MPDILVIGDAIIDHYEFGTMTRKSPEDYRVDIFDSSTSQRGYDAAGGCLNVAANLSGLSRHNDVKVASALSCKARMAFKKNYGMAFHYPYSIYEDENLVKTRLIDEATNRQVLRIDTNRKYTEHNCEMFSVEFELDRQFDGIVISDYDKGLINNRIIEKLADAVCPIFIDTKKKDFSIWQALRYPIVKINEREFAAAENYEYIPNLIITQGSAGAMWRGGADRCWKDFETKACAIADVIGAGDVFLAGLVTEFLRSFDFNEAMQFANHAASISVNRFGTYVVTQDDLIARQKESAR